MGAWFEAPRAWNLRGALEAPATTVRLEVTGAGFVWTTAQEKVDLERGGDVRQQLEANAFSQAVFDHGDHALAHAAPFAEALLGCESLKPDVPKVDAEVQDHVLDRDGLFTKVVWHTPVKQDAITPSSFRAYPHAGTGGDRPREIFKEIDSSGTSVGCSIRLDGSHRTAGGGNSVDRYNFRLTGRRPQSAHARLPGQEEPIA